MVSWNSKLLVRIIPITSILLIHLTVYHFGSVYCLTTSHKHTYSSIIRTVFDLSSHTRKRRNHDSNSFLQKLYSRRDDFYDYEEYADTLPRVRMSSTTPYWNDNSDWNEDDLPESVTQPQKESLEPDVLEWERCTTSAGTAWVLLPPPSVSQPTCVVHFVGGTLMGSAPNIWYRTLLQDIVRHTSCVVIATSIPVTLSQSPLNHVRLSTQLLQQFRMAYRDVLMDEYGSEALQSIPLCGIGHSLGARLLTVLATTTLGKILSPNSSRHGAQTLSYKSYILISFTNYGAAAGIPGIAQLFRKSRRLERQRQPETPPSYVPDDMEWEEEDDDDEDLLELWQEVSDFVQAGTTRVQTALTPPSQALEFHPTPEQLWTAIQQDERYTIPQTLIVQFDDDEIDQSSQLATSIVNCSDTKFARLRGTHLTPISFISKDPRNHNRSFLQQINSRAGRLLLQLLQGRHQSSQVEALRELRQSIARYITEVVTKP